MQPKSRLHTDLSSRVGSAADAQPVAVPASPAGRRYSPSRPQPQTAAAGASVAPGTQAGSPQSAQAGKERESG